MTKKHKAELPQTLWQKLNSPQYTKVVGKKLFCYSLVSLLVSFVLAVLLRNTFIATFFREVFIYSFLGLPIGGFLWIEKSDGDYTYNTHRKRSILDPINPASPNNPANPNHWSRY